MWFVSKERLPRPSWKVVGSKLKAGLRFRHVGISNHLCSGFGFLRIGSLFKQLVNQNPHKMHCMALCVQNLPSVVPCA